MAEIERPGGKCAFCGREMTARGMSRHLEACPARAEAIAAADAASGKRQTLYHLRVQDAWRGLYWLNLEMNGISTLERLDSYLRAIWLECCGHMSAFYVGGAWTGTEVSMSRRADRVFEKGLELAHVYDFGTTSETTVRVVGQREGKPLSRHAIYLMARNEPPMLPCQACDRPASWLCQECMIEYGDEGLLCDEHVEDHPHDDYGPPTPLFNSPRVGMCGYCGPGEPPY